MFNTKKEIKEWLDKYGVDNYTINKNLTVDVDGNVNLRSTGLREIPVQFGVVNGYFSCKDNFLTSLKGSPKVVNKVFNCSGNRLKSLNNAPRTVGGDFSCYGNFLEDYSEILNTDLGGSFGSNEYHSIDKIKATFFEDTLLQNSTNIPSKSSKRARL